MHVEVMGRTEMKEEKAMTNKRLAQAVHGAHYCHYDEERSTLVVWHGVHTFNVIDIHTGRTIDTWSGPHRLGLSPEQWDDVGWRLHAARDNIQHRLAPEFAAENDGMDYLGRDV